MFAQTILKDVTGQVKPGEMVCSPVFSGMVARSWLINEHRCWFLVVRVPDVHRFCGSSLMTESRSMRSMAKRDMVVLTIRLQNGFASKSCSIMKVWISNTVN